MLSDPELVMVKVAGILDALGIEYLVGGSMASSIYGEPRPTHDVDFVADIKLEQIPPLVAALEGEFYVDGEMIREAIETRSLCNALHLPTMIKADFFIKNSGAWVEEEWKRRRLEYAGSGEERVGVMVASPEDMILQKLAWFRLGGGVSDRQWRDIIGLLQVKALALDFAYLRKWAAELGLNELLAQSLEDAELNPDAL